MTPCSSLRNALLSTLLAPFLCLAAQPGTPGPLAYDTSNPASPVKLVFIHHSTGENWLADGNGDLGLALRNANYFVSDTNYGWGPPDLDAGYETIGDHTDIGNFYSWFAGPHRDTYLSALYAESRQHADYSRLGADPGGENRVVMFKSCFPNSALRGSPADPIPPIASNPLRNEGSGSEAHTLSNAKGIYQSLLSYFATRQDRLFVLVTAPPLASFDTDEEQASLARLLNEWLVHDWLAGYPYRNVFVFDFYDVLTSNGGSTRTNDPNTNDLGWNDGNHHRYRGGAVEHSRSVAYDMSAYPSGDSHPSEAGNRKATGEFVPLLNIAWHCWQGTGSCPTYDPATCSVSCSATVPSAGTAGSPVSLSGSATVTGCAGSAAYDWDWGDGTTHGTSGTSASATHTYASAGTYAWTFTATAGGQRCVRTGSITVAGGGGPACSADGATLCLNGSRFKVQAAYRNYGGETGSAAAVPLTDDTGYFWFFARTNVEVVVKVLDFCSVNKTWSVYASGLTDLGVTLTVTDTQTSAAKSYTNDVGTPFVLRRDPAFACP